MTGCLTEEASKGTKLLRTMKFINVAPDGRSARVLMTNLKASYRSVIAQGGDDFSQGSGQTNLEEKHHGKKRRRIRETVAKLNPGKEGNVHQAWSEIPESNKFMDPTMVSFPTLETNGGEQHTVS